MTMNTEEFERIRKIQDISQAIELMDKARLLLVNYNTTDTPASNEIVRQLDGIIEKTQKRLQREKYT